MKITFESIRRESARYGFSLVEVVLATGIMALGVVTILGLLPAGLEMTRKTANEQAETRIIDTIVGEIQSLNWGSVQEGQAQTRFFDDQGLEIQKGGQNFNIDLAYVVNVQVPETDVILPNNDAAGGNQPNPNLRRVIIKMIAAPLENFDFNQPTPTVPIRTFTQLVANMGVETNPL